MKWPVEVAPTLNTLYGTKMGLEDQHAFGGAGLFVPVISASNGQENAAITVDFASTLTALHEQPYIAVPQHQDTTAMPESRATFTSPQTGLFKEDPVSTTITRNSGAGGETQNPAWVIEPAVYESHPNDSRVTGPVEQCPTVAARWGTGGNNTPLVQQPIGLDPEHNSIVDGYGTLRAHTSGGFEGSVAVPVQQPMAIPLQDCREMDKRQNGLGIGNQGDPAYTLDRMATQGVAVQQPMAVRRLTPIECERLQGFPDGWTDIKPGGKDTPDSPRYKALGNSMAVPCMAWIGRRIEAHK